MKNKVKIIFERAHIKNFFEKEKDLYMNYCKTNNPAIITVSMFRNYEYTMEKFGIKFTSCSYRRKFKFERVWYFDITDEKKFILFKLKYGFKMV